MKIAFLGDSITKGHTLENESKRFSTLMCNALGAEEQNCGSTGTLVAKAGLSKNADPLNTKSIVVKNGLSVDLKQPFVERVMDMKGADYAVVFGGTNDYYWSDTPISDCDDSESVAYFKNAVDYLCKCLLTMYPKERILFVTPYPHHGCGNYYGGESWLDPQEHDTDGRNYLGHQMLDYVDAIIEVCNRYDIECVDLYRTTTFDWKKMTTDGCHPNEAGHCWICDQLLSAKLW